MSGEDSFFSVAMTTPFLALMPRDVSPLATAASAFSIWGSFPLAAKVVREKSDMFKKYLNNGIIRFAHYRHPQPLYSQEIVLILNWGDLR